MKYINTRNDREIVDSSEAIVNGLALNGGLYVPDQINKINDIYKLRYLDYKQLANSIISLFFSDVEDCIDKAYGDNFDSSDITPIKKVNDEYFLELHHGPTCAFKDVALQFLPHILLKSNNDNKPIAILSATSGDTGKAALEGFRDVPNTKICILYPYKMVSTVQERQMSSTLGNNTEVLAVKGNFDDCQRLVKDILENNKLDDIHLTSANSINIARLIPQVIYYFKAYFDLLNKDEISKDELVDYYVPTGNFGDILAGYIAKLLGLPIDKLICASNSNNVLTDFLNKGIYKADRPLYNTMEPSIDILVSSNLERLLYLKSKDTNLVNRLMEDLRKNKEYQISEELLSSIKQDFKGIYVKENEVKKIIKEYYDKYNYLIDPHTAVALMAAKKDNSKNKKVILSTASPFKFSKDVYKCLTEKEINDDLNAIETLEKYTNLKAPNSLSNLKNMEVRFKEVIEKDDKDIIINKLGVNHD